MQPLSKIDGSAEPIEGAFIAGEDDPTTFAFAFPDGDDVAKTERDSEVSLDRHRLYIRLNLRRQLFYILSASIGLRRLFLSNTLL